MIVRARTVVTMNGPPIDNGAVVVSEHQILDVGKFDEIKTQNAGEIVDLGEQALLPGLINAHCHLDYTCLRGKISPQKSFADWIRAINAEKSKLSAEDYVRSIREGFAEAKRFGTTSVANLTAFSELVSQIGSPIRTWWFAELIDVRTPERPNEIVDRAIESLKAVPSWGLAPHALFTASKDLYRHCEEIARRENISLSTHLAESREEIEMFRDGSGPLYEFMKSIGRDMTDCGSETPLEVFLSMSGGRSLPAWIIAHLNELTESDFALLKRSGERFHIVHCPRSHQYFGHTRFGFERLRLLGFNICLGTDSLASNKNLSLFAEMRAFQKEFPRVSPEEILKMVTVNPATALHQQDMIGRVRPGFCADLIAVPCGERDSPFEQIVEFDRSIDWVMVNGKM